MPASRLSSLAMGLMVIGADASYTASNVYPTEKTTSELYSVVPVTSQTTLATTSYCTNTTISTVIKSSTKHTTTHANVTVPHYTVAPTVTVPVTITETPTCTTTTPPPIITHNSCDQTCSMSAGTVNLFFWPTDNDYIYPSTHVDTDLGYTFTSPSVYMLIPTIYGTNTVDGGIVQPTATSAVWGFDLSEVSTIEGGTATKQLSLSDLGTDCPQTAAASEIATMVDSRCDPILAAPDKIRAWASPCAACERFGLFDPPYAIPTITGGLVPTTTAQPPPPPTTEAPAPAPTTEAPAPTTEAPAPQPTTEAPAPQPTTEAPAPQPTTEAPAPQPTTEAPEPTTEAPAPAPAPSVSTAITTGPNGVVAVYYENGRAVATATLAPPPASPSTTATAAPTSAEESAQPTTDAGVSATSATSAVDSQPTTSSAAASESGGASASGTTPAASTSATDGVTSPTPVVTAAAAQMKSGVTGLVAAGLLMPLVLMA
ncbi:hypothetical protein PG991_009677 [Apiospora marii]|uniref:Uncharacterized protein n=1 Tax=Apiospora marii TaxID=335849 RepID=A0ABR1RG90_9PEZI